MSDEQTQDEQVIDVSTNEERILPLVILGEMVIMPRIPAPLQVGKGKSYRAMEQAMEGNREVLLIFVPDSEIDG